MKHTQLFGEFVNEKYELLTEAKNTVEIPQGYENIFILDKKMPFGLPTGVADYYVSRTDGKIGTASWGSFKALIKANPGIKFGTYANAKRINIYQVLGKGQILTMQEVYIQK